jgi:DNA-binding NtrC family response regulator
MLNRITRIVSASAETPQNGSGATGSRTLNGARDPHASALEPERGDRSEERGPTASLQPLTPLHVVVVDEDATIRKACVEIVAAMGFYPVAAESLGAARVLLSAQPVDLLLLDLKLPTGSGLAFLEEVRDRFPGVAVVVMTAFATVNSAVEAMRSGASDYLTKPFDMEQLTEVLERASREREFDVEARALRDQIRASATAGLGPLVGRSPVMEKLYRMLGKVASGSHPVLLLGESGTGKEVVARLIHAHGAHAAKPFIPVDCGSLVPTLIESELFGHVKGAFTGALRAKEGLMVAAGSGTVFLDEIGELPLDLQAKLLRVLQEKEVRPVGATYSMPVAARILAATNQDLERMVQEGRFRRDLYHRLNVVSVQLPALRERKGDIPLLAGHALERLARESGKRVTFSDEALRMLNDYDWPGNVRELEHAVERAITLSSGPLLHRADFPPEIQRYQPARAARGHHCGDGEGGYSERHTAVRGRQAHRRKEAGHRQDHAVPQAQGVRNRPGELARGVGSADESRQDSRRAEEQECHAGVRTDHRAGRGRQSGGRRAAPPPGGHRRGGRHAARGADCPAQRGVVAGGS